MVKKALRLEKQRAAAAATDVLHFSPVENQSRSWRPKGPGCDGYLSWLSGGTLLAG